MPTEATADEEPSTRRAPCAMKCFSAAVQKNSGAHLGALQPLQDSERTAQWRLPSGPVPRPVLSHIADAFSSLDIAPTHKPCRKRQSHVFSARSVGNSNSVRLQFSIFASGCRHSSFRRGATGTLCFVFS